MRRISRDLMALLRFGLRPLLKLAGRLQLRLGGDDAKLRRRAGRLATAMLSEFSRLGFQKKLITAGAGRRRRGRVLRQRVKFEYPLLLTREELWCPIDIPDLPMGVRTDDLCDESVLRSLEDRLDCSVRVDRLASGKLCFVVRLGGNRFPAVYSINNVSIAPDRPALTIPAGVTGDGDPVLLDLVEIKHLLVGGSTGGGKTTFQHAVITTLLQRNGAQDIELWLIDMKRAEFGLYRPLMGKRGDGAVRYIAVEPTDAIEVLDNCFREIDKRNKLMDKYGATNIDDLRKVANVRLKRIVLIVDEFAILTTDSTKLGRESIGSIATRLMTRIASLGRSAGVSIIIATQMINKDVLSGTIRANFENRICFSVADWRQSQLMIETSEADGLPAGRAVMRIEGKTTEVQTAYITPRQVRVEVSRIAEFGPTGTGDDEDLVRFVRQAQLLVTVACQQLGGDFARQKLLQLDGVRGVISKATLEEICQRLERDGVLTPGGPRKPRRVAPAFFNRPNLIASLYGIQPAGSASHTRAEDSPELSWPEVEDTARQPQEAEKSTARPDADTAYGPEQKHSHVASEDAATEDEQGELDEDAGDDESGDGLEPFRRVLG